MIGKIQKLDKKAKIELLATTLALAIFVVLIVNVLISIVYVLELIKAPDFETIWFSFERGYYTINSKKMGVPIALNFIGVLFLWILMVFHTLKSINKSISYIL
jgi:hypothetical protein